MTPAVFIILVVALLARVTPLAAAVAHRGQPVMGTVLEVTVVASDRALAERLASDAIAIAQHWDDVLTIWRPDGELARLNARAGSGPTTVSADLAGSVRRMQEMHSATGGAFDPAVGPLVRIWTSAAPSRHGVAKARTQPFRDVVHATSTTVTLARGAALDSGAIGKSIALDAIEAHLRRRGAQAAFLDFGGSSQLAIGVPPGNPSGWTVVVAGLGQGEILGQLSLRDTSVSTSRAAGAGAEAGPIIDPRDGTPVPPPRMAVVLATDATTANAWSTALVVLGRDGLDPVTKHQLHALVADATGRVQTPEFPLASFPGEQRSQQP